MILDMGTRTTPCRMAEIVVDINSNILKDDDSSSANDEIVSTGTVNSNGSPQLSQLPHNRADVTHNSFNLNRVLRHIDNNNADNDEKCEEKKKSEVPSNRALKTPVTSGRTTFIQTFSDITGNSENVKKYEFEENNDHTASSRVAQFAPKASVVANFNNKGTAPPTATAPPAVPQARSLGAKVVQNIRKLNNIETLHIDANKKRENNSKIGMPLISGTTSLSTPKTAKEKSSTSVNQSLAVFTSPRDLRYLKRMGRTAQKFASSQVDAEINVIACSSCASMDISIDDHIPDARLNQLIDNGENRSIKTSENQKLYQMKPTRKLLMTSLGCSSEVGKACKSDPPQATSNSVKNFRNCLVEDIADEKSGVEHLEVLPTKAKTVASTNSVRAHSLQNMQNTNKEPSAITPRTRRRRRKTLLTQDLPQSCQKRNIDDIKDGNKGKSKRAQRRRKTLMAQDLPQSCRKKGFDEIKDNNNSSKSKRRNELKAPSTSPQSPKTSVAAKETSSPSVKHSPIGFLSPRDFRYLKRSKLREQEEVDQSKTTAQDLFKTKLQLTFGTEKRIIGEDDDRNKDPQLEAAVASPLFSSDIVATAQVDTAGNVSVNSMHTLINNLPLVSKSDQIVQYQDMGYSGEYSNRPRRECNSDGDEDSHERILIQQNNDHENLAKPNLQVDVNIESCNIKVKKSQLCEEMEKSHEPLITPVAAYWIKNFDDLNENSDKMESMKPEAPSTIKLRTKKRKSLTPNLKQILRNRNFDDINDNESDENKSKDEKEAPLTSTVTASPKTSIETKEKPLSSSKHSPKGFLSPRDLRYLKRSRLGKQEDPDQPSNAVQSLFKTNLQLNLEKESERSIDEIEGKPYELESEMAPRLVFSDIDGNIDVKVDIAANNIVASMETCLDTYAPDTKLEQLAESNCRENDKNNYSNEVIQHQSINDSDNMGKPLIEQQINDHEESTGSSLQISVGDNSCMKADETQMKLIHKAKLSLQECEQNKLHSFVTLPFKRERHFLQHITVPQINDRVVKLFQDNSNSVLVQPCVSARLFACFSLLLERDEKPLLVQGNVNQHKEKVHSLKKLHPLLPLLRAMVRVEDICLGGVDQTEESDMTHTENEVPHPLFSSSKKIQDDSVNYLKKKRVHFSGFDCSSIIPPVDSIRGSQTHQEKCILALQEAVDQVKAIVNFSKSSLKDEARERKNGKDNDIAPKIFQDQLIDALNAIIDFCVNVRMDTVCKIHVLCAKSIAHDYPPKRILTALNQYQKDFEILLSHISCNKDLVTEEIMGNKSSHDLFSPHGHITQVERKLAHFVGQAVRFHLREVLNVGVDTLIVMEVPPEARDTAAADGCVASLFSAALRHIHVHFGLNAFESLQFLPQKQGNCNNTNIIPIPSCEDSTKTLKQLLDSSSPSNARFNLSSDEFNKILCDIEDAISVVEVTRACRFLNDLLSIPLVQELLRIGNQNMEDDESGYRGWATSLQRYANIIKKHQLWKICPHDAHFALLSCELNTFVKYVNLFAKDLEPSGKNFEPIVSKLMGRYQRATKKKGRKKPSIKLIVQSLEEGIQRCNSFPRVVSSQ